MNNKIRQILNHNDSFTKQLEELEVNVFYLNELLVRENNKSAIEMLTSELNKWFHTVMNVKDKIDNTFDGLIIERLASVQLSLKKIQLIYSIHSEDIYNKMVKLVDDQIKEINKMNSEEEKKDGCS